MRLFLFALLWLACGVSARADVVLLIDGTKLNAKLVHYYDGMFTFDVAGERVKVPQSKVRSISFEAPKPRAEFSTPRKTFDQWLAAARAHDVKRMLDCYALMFQGVAMKQLEAMSAKDREAMWKEVSEMKLKWESVKVNGDRAVATVRAKRGKEEALGQLNFVKENGEWKMTPGPMMFGQPEKR